MQIEWLIPIAVFLIVVLFGGVVVVIAVSKRRVLRARLELVADAAPIATSVESLAERLLGRIGAVVSGGKASHSLREQLARAGFHSSSAAATFIGIKILLLLVGLGIGLGVFVFASFSMATEIFLLMLPAVVCFFLPNFYVNRQRKKRGEEMRCHLPDVVDLLEICVSGGMGLDAAWQAVTDEMRLVSPVVTDEMALAMLEMNLGAPRTIALRHMAERTGAQELSSLVGMLVQSDRFGTSVSEALRTFANSMREARTHSTEEQAEKTAVKLLFPLVLFIFPAMMIVLGAPAMLTLQKMMEKK